MISLKTSEEIKIMAEAGKKLAKIMGLLEKEIKIGIKTKFLDKKAGELIKKENVTPAFLNYNSFPANICVSVNDVIVHGIPSDYVIQNGDLVKIDIGIKYKNFYADMAKTIGVGKISAANQKLIKAVEEAFYASFKKAYPNNTLGDIGYAIYSTALKYGFRVANRLTGHGIGKKLHEDPQVLNFGQPKKGIKIRTGMVLAIEPMFIAGDSGEVVEQEDGSWKSKNGLNTAHFEHTIAILNSGPVILTQIK